MLHWSRSRIRCSSWRNKMLRFTWFVPELPTGKEKKCSTSCSRQHGYNSPKSCLTLEMERISFRPYISLISRSSWLKWLKPHRRRVHTYWLLMMLRTRARDRWYKVFPRALGQDKQQAFNPQTFWRIRKFSAWTLIFDPQRCWLGQWSNLLTLTGLAGPACRIMARRYSMSSAKLISSDL